MFMGWMYSLLQQYFLPCASLVLLQGVVDGPVMVPSIDVLVSARLKNRTA